MKWRPSATISLLQMRAELLKKIRDFFYEREVLEVETPLMCHTSVTDPFIQSIPVRFQGLPWEDGKLYYLQTSPEYAMKRLLAAGSGAIYQISKAFRQGEVGRYHNPEFTMLEWYRLGWDHHALMDEMDAFLQITLGKPAAIRQTYAELFQSFLQIDPFNATLEELQACVEANHICYKEKVEDRDVWLTLLMMHCIEPHLGKAQPHFVYDFPVSQAALARIQPGNPPVASRFEVYFRGIELANGFHELQDATEQRKRFEKNLEERKTLGFEALPIDEFFLSALSSGLPDCAGVAIGIDRLLMLAAEADSVAEVMSFDFSRV